MRIEYSFVGEGDVSICAVQTESTFRRFRKDTDGTIEGHEAVHDHEHIDDIEPPAEESCCVCASLILMLVGAVFPHTILLVEDGRVGKDEMFRNARSSIGRAQWLMRIFGFVLMTAGIYLIFSPVAELLSFLPWIDSLLKGLFVLVA